MASFSSQAWDNARIRYGHRHVQLKPIIPNRLPQVKRMMGISPSIEARQSQVQRPLPDHKVLGSRRIECPVGGDSLAQVDKFHAVDIILCVAKCLHLIEMAYLHRHHRLLAGLNWIAYKFGPFAFGIPLTLKEPCLPRALNSWRGYLI